MPLQHPIRARRVAERPEEYFEGVPNRDLTEDEYRSLQSEQRKLVRESGLWEVKTDAEMKPAIHRAERTIERAAEQAGTEVSADAR